MNSIDELKSLFSELVIEHRNNGGTGDIHISNIVVGNNNQQISGDGSIVVEGISFPAGFDQPTPDDHQVPPDDRLHPNQRKARYGFIYTIMNKQGITAAIRDFMDKVYGTRALKQLDDSQLRDLCHVIETHK